MYSCKNSISSANYVPEPEFGFILPKSLRTVIYRNGMFKVLAVKLNCNKLWIRTTKLLDIFIQLHSCQRKKQKLFVHHFING